MRFLKNLCLVASTALMVMALVGSSSAMATGSTSICTVEQEPCQAGNQVQHVHLVSAKADTILLNQTLNVNCIALFLGDAPTTLANPLVIKGSFTYTSCTVGCVMEEITPTNSSLLKVLRTASELSELTPSLEVHLNCFGFIDCFYIGTGLKGHGLGPLTTTDGKGHVTISNQEVKFSKGTNCPPVDKLDVLFVDLTVQYIST